jgi:hypothetical protein
VDDVADRVRDKGAGGAFRFGQVPSAAGDTVPLQGYFRVADGDAVWQPQDPRCLPLQLCESTGLVAKVIGLSLPLA